MVYCRAPEHDTKIIVGVLSMKTGKGRHFGHLLVDAVWVRYSALMNWDLLILVSVISQL
jgi:hypothetical protein